MSEVITKAEQDVWQRYHTPGCTDAHLVKINAVFFNIHNTEAHELAKAKACWDIKKVGGNFICEAEINGGKRRVDIVSLSEDTEYEIETNILRAKRFIGQNNVFVVPVGWDKKDPRWVEWNR